MFKHQANVVLTSDLQHDLVEGHTAADRLGSDCEVVVRRPMVGAEEGTNLCPSPSRRWRRRRWLMADPCASEVSRSLLDIEFSEPLVNYVDRLVDVFDRNDRQDGAEDLPSRASVTSTLWIERRCMRTQT